MSVLCRGRGTVLRKVYIHEHQLKVRTLLCVAVRDRFALAAADTHPNADEGLETRTAVDQQVLVPFYDALLEEYHDRRATYIVPGSAMNI